MAADVGTLQRIPRLVPEGIVRELAYTGRRFVPEEALKHGLVNKIFESKRCDMLEELVRNIGNMLFNAEWIEAELVKVNIKKFNPEGMNIPYVEVGCIVSHD